MPFQFFSFTPCSALQPFVRCYACVKGDDLDCWDQTLIPGNRPALGFVFNGVISSSLSETTATRSFVVGQMERPAAAVFAKDLDMIVVIFNSTGMYGLFAAPMQQFTDKGADFELVCSQKDKAHVERVFECREINQRIAAIEALLLGRLSCKLHPYHDRIVYASSLITFESGHLPLAQLARQVNMSKRNLERHFSEQVGVSPKSFCGIIRIKKVLQLIDTNPHMTWKDITHLLQYTDHPHFIHEFKKFTGTTPGAWSRASTAFEHFTTNI
jgi:AraC-like DNA-binding protein